MSFWNNKRVTVTGGAGFLGSYVVEKLQHKGAKVFVPGIEDYDLRKVKNIRRMFNSFSSSVSEPSNSLIGNTQLIAKIYFLRIIIPISSIVTSFIDFLVSFVRLILLKGWYHCRH